METLKYILNEPFFDLTRWKIHLLFVGAEGTSPFTIIIFNISTIICLHNQTISVRTCCWRVVVVVKGQDCYLIYLSFFSCNFYHAARSFTIIIFAIAAESSYLQQSLLWVCMPSIQNRTAKAELSLKVQHRLAILHSTVHKTKLGYKMSLKFVRL